MGNCQVGVFLAYAAPRGHALLDGDLYLPQQWIDDPQRCQAAGVPAATPMATKGELAWALLHRARQTGQWAGHWVTADAVYGSDPALRDAVDRAQLAYVFEVRSTARVFVRRPVTAVPAWKGRGRKPQRERRVADSGAPQTVAEVAATVPVQPRPRMNRRWNRSIPR